MDVDSLQRGGLIGLAMVTVSTGSNLIVQGKLAGGALLVIIGFGFIFWREWLKYSKKKSASSSAK